MEKVVLKGEWSLARVVFLLLPLLISHNLQVDCYVAMLYAGDVCVFISHGSLK